MISPKTCTGNACVEKRRRLGRTPEQEAVRLLDRHSAGTALRVAENYALQSFDRGASPSGFWDDVAATLRQHSSEELRQRVASDAERPRPKRSCIERILAVLPLPDDVERALGALPLRHLEVMTSWLIAHSSSFDEDSDAE